MCICTGIPDGSEALTIDSDALPDGAKLSHDFKTLPVGSDAHPNGLKTLPAGSEALPNGSENLSARSWTLLASSESLPAGSKPFLAGSKPLPDGSVPVPGTYAVFTAGSEAFPLF